MSHPGGRNSEDNSQGVVREGMSSLEGSLQVLDRVRDGLSGVPFGFGCTQAEHITSAWLRYSRQQILPRFKAHHGVWSVAHVCKRDLVDCQLIHQRFGAS